MKFQHMESCLSITLLSIDPLPLSHQSLCRNFQLEFWDFYRDPSKEIEIMHNTHLYIFVTNLPILRRRFFNNIDCGLSMKRIPLAHEQDIDIMLTFPDKVILRLASALCCLNFWMVLFSGVLTIWKPSIIIVKIMFFDRNKGKYSGRMRPGE